MQKQLYNIPIKNAQQRARLRKNKIVRRHGDHTKLCYPVVRAS